MRFFLTSSFIVILFISSFLESGLTSCTKDNTIYDTVTVVQKDTVTVKDTVIIKDTLLTTAILTANAWKYQEYRGVGGGDTIVYYRGGTLNTYNYDADNIVFYVDGTGNLHDADGYDHAVKDWKFTNDEHTKLTFTFYDLTVPTFVTWENIRYKNGAIRYDEYYHDNYNGLNVHDQAVRIPQ